MTEGHLSTGDIPGFDGDQRASEVREFTDPRQERVCRRLLLIGPGPAAFFADACQLVDGRSGFPSATHLVAHLVREIESALRAVLEPLAGGSTVEAGGPCSGQPSHADRIRAILKALEFPEDDPVGAAWLGLAKRGSDGSPARRAHRDALGFRGADGDFLAWWERVQTVLDAILGRFEERYNLVLHQLDALLASRSPDVSTLKNSIPNNRVAHRYFFGKLNDPDWIGPLINEGMFQHPPAPELAEDSNGVSFPEWPITSYLARMAAEYPSAHDQVLRAALAVPSTDDVRVHLDLTRVALALPAELGRQLVPAAIRWLECPYRPIAGQEFGRLVGHLAGGGAIEEALSLAGTLFDAGGYADPSRRERAGARLTLWEYGEALGLALPSLAPAAPIETLQLLCEQLERAMVQSFPSLAGANREWPAEDCSSSWRPAIEDHEQNFDREDILDVLVGAIRDVVHFSAEADAGSVHSLVATLESRRWKVFLRIALDLLAKFPDAARDLVVDRLTSRMLFDDSGMRHEYYHLQRTRFGELDSKQQSVVLGWIDAGPDLDDFAASATEVSGREPTDEELVSYANRWRIEKLTPIVAYLTATRKETYEKLVQEVGEPEHPDFAGYRGTSLGPTSPLSVEELEGMATVDLAAYLCAWRPSGEWGAATPEGLGRLVTTLVAENPEPYASAAADFVGLEATYVRSLLQGLRQAVESKKPFPWEPALGVARTVVHDPWATPPRSDEHRDRRDPDWGWTRKTIAGLLGAGLQPGPGEIPYSLRETVWVILEPLTNDPDPTPQDEEARGRGGFNPATLSINTIRGEAMHTAVHYGLWVQRHHEVLASIVAGAAAAPVALDELWETLDVHLDVERDPSLAIRSVYGQWFPWLRLLDPSWAESRRPMVFPADMEQRAFWDAAWTSYVVSCRPFDDVFALLRPEYERAVERMGSVTGEAPVGQRPEERLGEHFATFAWRGGVTVDPIDPLLADFWSKAPTALRKHVLGYVGRSLRDWPSDMSQEVMDRLKALWLFALEAAERPLREEAHPSGAARQLAGEADELAAFAWWFASGKFDDEWAFARLEFVMQRTSLLNPAYMIARRLAVLVRSHPRRSVAALAALVDRDREGWRIGGWKDDAHAVLEEAIACGDPDAKRVALDVVNRLVAKGRLEFRDLAEPGNGGAASTDDQEMPGV